MPLNIWMLFIQLITIVAKQGYDTFGKHLDYLRKY